LAIDFTLQVFNLCKEQSEKLYSIKFKKIDKNQIKYQLIILSI